MSKRQTAQTLNVPLELVAPRSGLSVFDSLAAVVVTSPSIADSLAVPCVVVGKGVTELSVSLSIAVVATGVALVAPASSPVDVTWAVVAVSPVEVGEAVTELGELLSIAVVAIGVTVLAPAASLVGAT